MALHARRGRKRPGSCSAAILYVSRDHRKLRVFQLADSLLLDVYRITKGFPADERFILTGQLRRSALSAATNIVEGCARRGTREYVSFLNQANGSAAEARYLLTIAHRLAYLQTDEFAALATGYSQLLSGLQAMIAALNDRN